MTQKAIRIGIVTVSDRASRGEYEDLGGPAMRDWLEKALACHRAAVHIDPSLELATRHEALVTEALAGPTEP